MAVKIKLKRLGKIREPHYRIVVADSRTKRDGRAIEEIGKYYPKAEPSLIEVNSERAQHWLSVGAQPTDPVRVLLKITGDWQKFTGEPGAEGTLRTAEPRADKKEAFTAAAKASQASKEAKESKAGTQSRTAKPAKDTPPKDSAPRAALPRTAPPRAGPRPTGGRRGSGRGRGRRGSGCGRGRRGSGRGRGRRGSGCGRGRRGSGRGRGRRGSGCGRGRRGLRPRR